jgi:hypothetical protein
MVRRDHSLEACPDIVDVQLLFIVRDLHNVEPGLIVRTSGVRDERDDGRSEGRIRDAAFKYPYSPIRN